MKSIFLTHWRVFWRFRAIHLMRLLEHRGDFFFWTLVATMWTVFNFFFLDMIFRVGGSIAGWTRYELYVIIAIFSILDAFTWSFFYYNMKGYTEMVFNGELNMLLTKPIDTQFLLMTQHNSYNNIFRFLLGVWMLVWSVQKLGITPSFITILAFIYSLIVSFVFLYSLWFMLSTLSFYTEKLDNINEIFPAMRRVWQLPRSIYTGIASLIFTVIFPVALITSVPAELLLQKSSYWWLVYFSILSVGTCVASRWFFHYSVKRYSGIAN